MRPRDVNEFSDTALMIVWDDGHESIYLYEDLRESCPCAACKQLRKSSKIDEEDKSHHGHTHIRNPFLRKGVKIKPQGIEPVGHYAIRFKWNDGHDTGIYSFELLRRLCMCEECQSAYE
jgi:DUF971 family protein